MSRASQAGQGRALTTAPLLPAVGLSQRVGGLEVIRTLAA